MIYQTEQTRMWHLILILLACMGFSFSRTTTAADSIERSGNDLQILIPAIAYGTTFYLGDGEGRAEFYKAFFTNEALTYGLKYTVNETRPNGRSQSFPSGHTSAAFQGAAFTYQRYGWAYSIPAYIGAAFVGYSRVESHNHYIRDVLAGAAIGETSSFTFTKPVKGPMILPVVDKAFLGIDISENF